MKNKEIYWEAKHKGKLSDAYDLVEMLLLDAGVPEEDLKGFIRPTKKHINDPFLMKNMDKAIEVVRDHVNRESKILVRVDSDADGYTSASTLIQFLLELNPDLQIDFIQNFEKHHGLTYSDMGRFTRDEYGLILIPDASMTESDAKMITDNFSADIVVLDHHLVSDGYVNYCTAVNCTDGQYPNPTLSGAGVVQKFIEAYVDTYGEKDGLEEELKEKYLDLVSLGILADSMDIRNLETRYYVVEGLRERSFNNELLNEFQEKLKEDMPFGRTIMSIGWKFGPLINAVVRYGSPDEQRDLFRAIKGEREDIEYQPRRKSKDDPKPEKEIHSLQKTMARVAGNVKARQDKEVRELLKEVQEEVEAKELWKNTVLFIDGTNILNRGTISGLVANKLVSNYLRPVVIMRSRGSMYFGGSGRNYGEGNIENLNEFLTKAGVECMG